MWCWPSPPTRHTVQVERLCDQPRDDLTRRGDQVTAAQGRGRRRRRCDTYWPGHQVHWIAVKHAHRSGSLFGHLTMEGDQPVYVATNGKEYEVFNHDKALLHDLAKKHEHGQLYLGRHLLLVGGVKWLSVSFEPLEPCRSSRDHPPGRGQASEEGRHSPS